MRNKCVQKRESLNIWLRHVNDNRPAVTQQITDQTERTFGALQGRQAGRQAAGGISLFTSKCLCSLPSFLLRSTLTGCSRRATKISHAIGSPADRTGGRGLGGGGAESGSVPER